MEYILASASPRRRELLSMLSIPFATDPAAGEESLPETLPVTQAAEYLAMQKALEVAARHPEALVIGADTTVLCGDKILGKPRDYADCCRMLRLLSDRTHCVQTGVALICGTRSHCFTVETQVTFYPLHEAEISAYAATDEPYDKAGGYAIQGHAALFIAGIQGDYYNVMGLPIARLARELRTFHINHERHGDANAQTHGINGTNDV